MGSSPEILFFFFGLSLVLSVLATASSSTLAALGEHRAAALLEDGGGPRGLAAVVRRSDSVRLALLTLDGMAKLALGSLGVVLALGAPHPELFLGGGALAVLVLLTAARALAARQPQRSVILVAPFAAAVDVVLRPLVAPLAALARKARGSAGPLQGTTEEIEYLIEVGAKQGVLEKTHRDLLESVLDFSSVRVREIMVPRPKVVALDANASYEEVLKVVTESEHSRLPVYENSIDNVVGILYARRLLKVLRPGPDARAAFRLRAHLTVPYFIPESMKISLLLAEFQRRRTHIAMVVDEFGGTSGVVTLEDVVEEIVGEIRDETDGEELSVRRSGERSFAADGSLSLRDLEGFLEELLPSDDRFEFPEDGDYETLAGFVSARVGRVPEAGDEVREGDLVFVVKAADQKRVTRVEITRLPPQDPEEETPGRNGSPVETRREPRGVLKAVLSVVTENRPDLRALPLPALMALVGSLGEKPYRATQLFRWLHRRFARSLEEMTDLPAGFRKVLAERTELTLLELDKSQVSEDGTIKFRFRTFDGKLIESVYMPDEERGRRTLCVSTQAGCAMGCGFCATAQMGLARHLTAGEIADQAHRVNRYLIDSGLVPGPRPLTNLVYMGMGEPLHNFDNVKASIDILLHEDGPNFSHRHVTVSTVGLVPMIPRLGAETEVKLAISLNATTDEVRDRIMPVNHRWKIADLMAACRTFPMKQGRRITFEYVLFAGINDSDEDIERLAALVRTVPAKVNLIQYNRNEGLPFEPAPPERVQAFVDGLMARGVQAMARKNRGRDILAACGQLAAEGGPGRKPARGVLTGALVSPLAPR